MPRKEIHVVPNEERGGWDAKKPELSKTSKHFENKQDAMDWSREQAKQDGRELIPPGKDGKIQNLNSYKNDPCPPKDKKH
ncbi:MAG TPA: hypothetical protein DD434_02445 [Bacteroidales bacterium]|nr:hypothetical protein [Bacteroidales bacterium]